VGRQPPLHTTRYHHHHHNYGYRKIRCSLWFLLTEHLSPEDLKCQGHPFVQNHPFTIRSIALAHPRTTTFQRKNLSARSDQMPCSNTTAAEALLHLQSSHIQLNAPSRQPAGFQTTKRRLLFAYHVYSNQFGLHGGKKREGRGTRPRNAFQIGLCSLTSIHQKSLRSIGIADSIH
jgi:hypothetical protein